MLAAICEGQGILATHGALNDKSVATRAATREYPAIGAMHIKWENKDVVVDGRVVTASSPEHTLAFADALIRGCGRNKSLEIGSLHRNCLTHSTGFEESTRIASAGLTSDPTKCQAAR